MSDATTTQTISPEITAQATALYEAIRPIVDELLGTQDGTIPGLAVQCTTVDEAKHLANVFSNLARRFDNPRPRQGERSGLAQVAYGKAMAAVKGATPVAQVTVADLSVEELQAALAARSAQVADDTDDPFAG